MYKRLDEIIEGHFDEKPGIYVFYYKPRIASYDLYEDDDLSGANEILKYIDEKLISPLNFKTFTNEIKVGYGSKLTGELSLKGRSIRDKNFSNPISDNSFQAVDLYSDFSVRSAFNKIMNELEHSFSAPIYVGVSHDLNERLLKHRASYFDAKDLIKQSAQVSDTDFGARAASFCSGDELYVKVHYFDSPDYNLTKKNAYDLALVTEWVIQQQYKPILGKN
jgi:hypothetical protein